MDFYQRLKGELKGLEGRDALRRLNTLRHEGLHAVQGARRFLNLSSNDYLGLQALPELGTRFAAEAGCTGTGGHSAASSRLLTGNHTEYALLEEALEEAYGRPALALNSGYHANIGILPALAGPEDVIFSDALNHASLIDGIRLSRAERQQFRHLDYDELEKKLAGSRGRFRNAFIVTESLFSMDGDLADLERLCDLKERFDAVLYVDEAHSAGVCGEKGLGLAEAEGVLSRVDLLLGTFGKAFSSTGAYLVSDSVVKEYLVNRMRSLLFTTALPPFSVAWSRFTFREALGMADRRRHLSLLAERLRAGLVMRGHETKGSSQIVPLILGENERAVTLARKLQDAGFLVFPIRPPTVPEGGARLRFSLNAGISEEDVDRLLEALA